MDASSTIKRQGEFCLRCYFLFDIFGEYLLISLPSVYYLVLPWESEAYSSSSTDVFGFDNFCALLARQGGQGEGGTIEFMT